VPVSERWSALAPEIMLPSQLLGRQGSLLQPEKRLMLAVLENAVSVLLRDAPVRDGRAGRHVAEAEEWVASDAVDWPFTFLNVCHALELDPGYIRGGLGRRARRRTEVGSRRSLGFRRLVYTRQRVNGRHHA
jgi:hypothetical protein